MLVREQAAHGIGNEQQPATCERSALDEQLLSLRLALIGADQPLGRHGLLNTARPRASLVKLLAARIALIDDLADCQHLIPRNRFLLIGFGKRALDLAVLGSGDFHRDRVRDHPTLNCGDQLFLAIIKQ